MYATADRAWTLQRVFGRPIHGACPIDGSSALSGGTVHLEVPSDRQVSVITTGQYHETKSNDGLTRHYEMPSKRLAIVFFARVLTVAVNADFDLDLSEYSTTQPANLEQPLLYAERTFTGHGQERGGVNSVLTNPSPDSAVEIVYLESLPWFMKPYLHTLRAQTSPLSPLSNISDPITSIVYRPGIDRRRGTHLEIHLTIPAASTIFLTYDFEKANLRYTEYPPDANRGFDVAPAIIRILPASLPQPGSVPEDNNDSNGGAADDGSVVGKSTYMRTTSLLLPLPTPDFSMPYNVIILTSTVIAMGFGSIFNLLVRRFVAADENQRRDFGAIKRTVVAGIQTFIKRVKGGKGVAEEEGEEVKKTQ